MAERELETSRLAAGFLAQTGDELEQSERSRKRTVRGRRQAILAHRHAPRLGDLGADLGPRQHAAVARLGALRAFKELIAASGLSHPNELGPEHIIRRVSSTEVRSLSALYHFVKPGELIGGLPDHAVFKVFWDAARTDSFAPPRTLLELHHTKSR